MANQPRLCQTCRNYIPGRQWDAHRWKCRTLATEEDMRWA